MGSKTGWVLALLLGWVGCTTTSGGGSTSGGSTGGSSTSGGSSGGSNTSGGSGGGDGGIADSGACADTPTNCGAAGACVDCTGSDVGHQCIAGACGCSVSSDCASGMACRTSTGRCATPVGCTPDLQSTTDSSGAIVESCPAGQGCAAGACIGACAAAQEAGTTLGCDFYAPTSPTIGNGPGGVDPGYCYAAFVVNAWAQPVHLTLDYSGTGQPIANVAYVPSGVDPSLVYAPYDATGGLPPGKAAIVFLSSGPTADVACPFAPAVEAAQSTAISGSGKGAAFHISSDLPVQVYDEVPYGPGSFVPSASLLYPTAAWGTNYVVTAAHAGTSPVAAQWLMIVGLTDATSVTINAPVTLSGGGVISDCVAGTPTVVTISHGEMLQWIGADPTGAVVQATHPVMVMAGNAGLLVDNPYGGPTVDSSHQQLPHVAALGSEYVAPGYTTREVSGVAEAITYKLTGTVDGTALAYDPSPPPAAPLSLNEGQSAEFSASSAFVVSSQDAAHPFSLTQYMSSGWDSSAAGCTPDGGPCGLGDPEWVILPTPAQFLEHYDFFTDPTFATTNLAVIRQAADGGFQDVSLACLGGPIANWTSVGAQGKYQVAYLDLYRSGAGVGGCGVSWHQAASAAPFGVVVWGTDSYASYAYSAGGGLAPLNNVIVNP